MHSPVPYYLQSNWLLSAQRHGIAIQEIHLVTDEYNAWRPGAGIAIVLTEGYAPDATRALELAEILRNGETPGWDLLTPPNPPANHPRRFSFDATAVAELLYNSQGFVEVRRHPSMPGSSGGRGGRGGGHLPSGPGRPIRANSTLGSEAAYLQAQITDINGQLDAQQQVLQQILALVSNRPAVAAPTATLDHPPDPSIGGSGGSTAPPGNGSSTGGAVRHSDV